MGDQVPATYSKCPEGKVWALYDGKWVCYNQSPWSCEVAAEKRSMTTIPFSGAEGCGLDFAYTLDQNDMPFCSPCQTVQYSCPSDSEIHEEEICPVNTLNDSNKTEFLATVRTNIAISALFEKNCMIRTAGWFYDTLDDWKKSGEAWTKQRIEEVLKPYLANLMIEKKGEQYIGSVQVRVQNLDGSRRLFDTIQLNTHSCSQEGLKRKWMEESFVTIFTMRLRVLPL